MNPAQFAAVVLLIVLAAVPLIGLAFGLARSRLDSVQYVLWGAAFLLCKFLWRARWLNELPLAADQGAVIVCNHRSSVDPFFIQTATGRKIHWMVAREYCEHPAFRWFLAACEVIPVNRGGSDTAATRSAMRIVAAGGLAGMLPEGRINMTDCFLLPVRPGAALVALKARVTVVPCYIDGAPYRRYAWSPLLMPARVTVRFGPPVDLSDLYDRAGETGVAQLAIERIAKALARVAGLPDFQPQIAGRNWKPTAAELDAAMDAADERSRNRGTGVGGQESAVGHQQSQDRLHGGDPGA